MNTTLIMNASEGRIQFVLEQEGSLACAQVERPTQGTGLDAPRGGRLLARSIMPSGRISRIACVAGRGCRPPAGGDRRRLPPGYPEPPLRRSMRSKPSRAPCPSASSFPARETRIRGVITRPARPCARAEGFSVLLVPPCHPVGRAVIPAACGRGARHHARARQPCNLPQLEGLFGIRAPLSAALTHHSAGIA